MFICGDSQLNQFSVTPRSGLGAESDTTCQEDAWVSRVVREQRCQLDGLAGAVTRIQVL